MSYTPLTLHPGFKNKYGKVLLAGSDPNKIRQALAEHGVNMDTNPYAMEIFERLRYEYVGRMTFGGSVAIAAYQYAMGGNIRGNGPANPAERKKLMDNYDWKPKTIKIGNRWHSYDGIPVLEHILSLVGDAAYYANEIGPEATEDAIDKLGWSISATYFHQTPLHGVEPLLAMLNGDDSALNRFKANMIRMAIPQSGNLAMINDAITSSQKAIYNDMMGYVMNRLPGAASTLPVRRDLWTGKPLNEGDNHLLRALNATGLVKVSDAVGDSRVYGVLASFSETDNKPIVASVGIGSVKVTGACSGGDLLESNGDGTAKVQSDDIIRSKTIGKVTIGNSNTGVKLVSCVLYCG